LLLIHFPLLAKESIASANGKRRSYPQAKKAFSSLLLRYKSAFGVKSAYVFSIRVYVTGYKLLKRLKKLLKETIFIVYDNEPIGWITNTSKAIVAFARRERRVFSGFR